MRAWRNAGRLTVSVRDPGFSGQSAGRRAATGLQVGGWGMQIVEALSQRWGEERDDGYRVWAEIDLNHPSRVAAPH